MLWSTMVQEAVRSFLRRATGAPGAASFARLDPSTTSELDPSTASELAAAAAASHEALGMEPTQRQLQAAAALMAGYGVEMDTGEGKTLAGALAAAGLARSGRRVHVLSANDYLADRDAAWMAPLYRSLGLSVTAIGQHSTADARREEYRADILYAAVAEIGYDVLRDGIALDERERVRPVLDHTARQGRRSAARPRPGSPALGGRGSGAPTVSDVDVHARR